MRIRRTMGTVAAGVLVAGCALLTQTGSASATEATASHTTCNYTNDEPTIGYGNAGPAVKQAQCQLNSALTAKHIYLTVDGVFGHATEYATEVFQTCAGVSSDGVIGPNTWGWLDVYWLEGAYC